MGDHRDEEEPEVCDFMNIPLLVTLTGLCSEIEASSGFNKLMVRGLCSFSSKSRQKEIPA